MDEGGAGLDREAMRRAVYFEDLSHAHRPLVAWYQARGYRIFVFDFTFRLKRLPWLRRELARGGVERIFLHQNSRADGLAIDAAEELFPAFAGDPLVRRTAGLFGPSEAHPVFKHSLTECLSRYFFTRLYLEERARGLAGKGEILFFPEWSGMWDRNPRLAAWCGARGIGPLRGVKTPRFVNGLLGFLRAVSERVRLARIYLRCAGRLALLPAARRLRRRAGRPPVQASIVYSVESRFQTRFSGPRRFDFLTDGERISKSNALFLVGPGAEGRWEKEAQALGYRLIRRSDAARLRGYWDDPPRALPLAKALQLLGAGLLRFAAPLWIHEAAARGLWVWISESNLLERMRFSHYIYANQYGLVPLWRNVLVRRAGAQSWWYAYSNGGGYLYEDGGPFAGGRDFGGRHHYWAYANADHFVSPCRQLADWHRSHRQGIRRYHDVGNLWSESILQAEAAGGRDAIRRGWFSAPSGRSVPGFILAPPGAERKVISWFDTTFVEAPNSLASFTEALQWYRDILRLADEDGRLAMVIKPSKDEGYFTDPGPARQWAMPRIGRQLVDVWEELRRHPRVRFLSPDADPSVVVAGSDLTVTYCFSSVSAEALGARKRAIWSEPGQRWRNTLLGREPGLTACGYEELRRLVERLLYGMTEAEYELFLETTVRGLVESFLDGKGISRFRALLAGDGEIPAGRPAWTRPGQRRQTPARLPLPEAAR